MMHDLRNGNMLIEYVPETITYYLLVGHHLGNGNGCKRKSCDMMGHLALKKWRLSLRRQMITAMERGQPARQIRVIAIEAEGWVEGFVSICRDYVVSNYMMQQLICYNN